MAIRAPRIATEAVMTTYRKRAFELGAELIAAERNLDLLFARKEALPELIDRATQQVGLPQARLRAEHLKTHLSQTALLTSAQVRLHGEALGRQARHQLNSMAKRHLSASITTDHRPQRGNRLMNLNQFLAASACSLLFAASASAHGDENHATKPVGKVPAHGHPDDSAAIGEAGDPARADRTVNVTMTDSMRFTPASVAARQGETIKFVVKNAGQLKHEMVLGTEKELKEHYELMKKFPEMDHSDPQKVTVAPGKTGEIVWRFTRAGKVDFACLQPGHYDAGMKGLVTVAAIKGATGKADGHSDHKH